MFMAGRQFGKREAARIQEVKDRGRVPDGCGSAIPEAPARGAVKRFTPVALVPDNHGGYVAKLDGYRGRQALKVADVFDVIEEQARRRKAEAPLSPTQVAMGRRYRDLIERHEGSGLKCQSFDDTRSGSGGDVMDAILREGREIDMLRDRIGSGVALAIRRVRPSQRGARVEITARALVDEVCLKDRSVRDVLARFGWGWEPKRGRELMAELAAVFDRMLGDVRPVRSSVSHFGGPPPCWEPNKGD